jgi:hypothetical protein
MYEGIYWGITQLCNLTRLPAIQLVHASLDNSKHGDNALQYGDLIVQPSFIQNTSVSDK